MRKLTIAAGACASLLLGMFVNSIYDTLNVLSKIKTEDKLNPNGEQNKTAWLRDWHDYADIEAALKREGLGEAGKPANIEEYRKELYNKYGFDALLSDVISLQRAVPDMRTEACWNISYIAKLPRTSIIIIFFNERLSVLMRTVYSIFNRTPAELLQEIVLVHDGSTWPDMQDELEHQLEFHFANEKGKVKLIRQGTRTGIMAARMAGARQASKQTGVLIFLDAHFEVGYNWLPPLLEPIANNPKTCTCPIIDRIAFDSFKYVPSVQSRGFFDFTMSYRMLPLYKDEQKHPARNYKNYVMMGGALAIGSDFFWQLGGFDEGMTHWGGEQFEISFKIWMCGGQLLDVPCSRMGHLFRDPAAKAKELLYGNFDFCDRNYRRFLDVWVEEEERKYFFLGRPALKDVDPGNLTVPNQIRQSLQCKSFSWMLENVMPDLLDHFPRIEPSALASGQIRSVTQPEYCIALGNDKKITLGQCPIDSHNIEWYKNWQYTWRGELRISGFTCLEPDKNTNDISSFFCHLSGGNQKWYYDRNMQWIVKLDRKLCVLANIEDKRVELSNCDAENSNLKWTFDFMNQTEMDRNDENIKINYF